MEDYQFLSLCATDFIRDGLQGLSRLMDMSKSATVHTFGQALLGESFTIYLGELERQAKFDTNRKCMVPSLTADKTDPNILGFKVGCSISGLFQMSAK